MFARSVRVKGQGSGGDWEGVVMGLYEGEYCYREWCRTRHEKAFVIVNTGGCRPPQRRVKSASGRGPPSDFHMVYTTSQDG